MPNSCPNGTRKSVRETLAFDQDCDIVKEKGFRIQNIKSYAL